MNTAGALCGKDDTACLDEKKRRVFGVQQSEMGTGHTFSMTQPGEVSQTLCGSLAQCRDLIARVH